MIDLWPLEPFSSQYFGGREQLSIEAANLFLLVASLDRLVPGFAAEADLRVAFAVNGVVARDWSEPLPEGAQVAMFPRVAGGQPCQGHAIAQFRD